MSNCTRIREQESKSGGLALVTRATNILSLGIHELRNLSRKTGAILCDLYFNYLEWQQTIPGRQQNIWWLNEIPWGLSPGYLQYGYEPDPTESLREVVKSVRQYHVCRVYTMRERLHG